jgi:hypothetical protein
MPQQAAPGRVASIARFPKAKKRVGTKRQQLLFAAEPVLQAPELPTLRCDKEEEAVRVKELARLVVGAGITNSYLVQDVTGWQKTLSDHVVG